MAQNAASHTRSQAIAASHTRSQAIDLIKGLAIVWVICLHTLSPSTLGAIGAHFHIWQAVPVFLFLMGYNATSSLRRRGYGTLRELYSREYLAARFDRVYVPFLVAFLVTLALAILTRTPHTMGVRLVGQAIVGLYPIDGPGNYFVTLLFEFVIVFPLVFWGLRRWPVWTLLACLMLNVAFVEAVARVTFFKDYPYVASTCIAGFLFLIALGGLCAGVAPARVLRSPWLWCGVLLGVAFLALVEADPSALPSAEASQANWSPLSGCYAAGLVLLGMTVLPAVAGAPLARVGAVVGRASYHIFLVQIAWFGLLVITAHSLLALAGNLAVTLSVGVVFYELMDRVPLPTASGLLTRRRASLAEAQKVGA
jgi:peptidoglycan/LPS O-acetylase OafA/YrhL